VGKGTRGTISIYCDHQGHHNQRVTRKRGVSAVPYDGGGGTLRVRRLLVTANVPTSPILVTLTMEALRSSETSVLTRATRRKIPEDATLHSHRRENLKSFMVLKLSHADRQTHLAEPILSNFCLLQIFVATVRKLIPHY
jgi:hypothetical protein